MVHFKQITVKYYFKCQIFNSFIYLFLSNLTILWFALSVIPGVSVFNIKSSTVASRLIPCGLFSWNKIQLRVFVAWCRWVIIKNTGVLWTPFVKKSLLSREASQHFLRQESSGSIWSSLLLGLENREQILFLQLLHPQFCDLAHELDFTSASTCSINSSEN